MTTNQLILRAGHTKPVWSGHPWIYAQAVADIEGAPRAGDVVTVLDPRRRFLGKGYFSPKSAIPLRILSRDPDAKLDDGWLAQQIEVAARRRATWLDLPSAETDAYRLVHADGDGLSGLIVDVFGSVASVQLLTAGMKRREDVVFGTVARVSRAKSVLEAASGRAQRAEGITATPRVARGPDVDALRLTERGLAFEIDVTISQKTGFYLDQRDNRRRVEELAAGRTVLDVCSFVGAFSLFAARGGAKSVVALDSSAPALAVASRLATRHGFSDRISFRKVDAKRALPELADSGARFDVVVLDPPKLVPTTAHLDEGRRAYERFNEHAIRLVAPGGMLVTCSCSAALRPPDFQRVVAVAAARAGRRATVVEEGRQAPDHPVPVAFPEGHYLKCLYTRID